MFFYPLGLIYPLGILFDPFDSQNPIAMNLKKLTSMSLNEVTHRLKSAGAKKLLRLARDRSADQMAAERFLKEFDLPSDYDGPYAEAIEQKRWRVAEDYLLEHMRARATGHGYHGSRPQFFFHPGQRPEMQRIVSDRLAHIVPQTLEHAEELIDHKFSFLGLEFEAGNEIDWHADPTTGQRWPNKFYTELKFYGQKHGSLDLPGDVKHVWELNRHQHFIVLGKAYWLTGDDKYAAEFLNQCNGWIEQNPFLQGINWTSALEAAMRSLSWIWAYFFCLEANSLDTHTNAAILRCLQLHGHYVARHLSHFTSPYNHLVGEATALYFIGTLFPEFREAAVWRKKGWTILESEITNQFHSDGMSVEQAVSYHHFTLGLYLQTAILAEHNGRTLSSAMRSTLEHALELSMLMQQPDGLQPMIGDSDDARSIYFGNRPAWDYRDLLSLGAILFQRCDFKKMAKEYDESSLWLMGAESLHKYRALGTNAPASRCLLLPKSGYVIFRSGWSQDDHSLIFDCGAQSHGLFPDANTSTAHGHADYLSFSLCGFGTPLLVDSGMWTYNGDLTWQNHFRSAMAHNTLSVNGRSPCKLSGRLSYSHVPEVEQSFYTAQSEFAFTEATYEGFGYKLRHRRGVFYRDNDYWLILDSIYGEGEHVLDRWLHFSADTMVSSQQHRIVTERGDGKNIMMQEIGPRFPVMQIFRGGDEPDQGWIAPAYGKKIPAAVVRMRAKEKLPAHFCTLITPFHEQTLPVEHCCIGEPSTQSPIPFWLRLTTKAWTDEIVFNFNGRKNEVGDYYTNAKILYLRRDARTKRASATMVQGTELSVAGVKLFNAERTIDVKLSALDLPLRNPDGKNSKPQTSPNLADAAAFNPSAKSLVES